MCNSIIPRYKFYLLYIFNKYTIKQVINNDWELDKKILKYFQKNKYLGFVNKNTNKKNSDSGFSLSDTKTYYKDSVIKAILCWYMHRHIDLKIESRYVILYMKIYYITKVIAYIDEK